MTKSAYVFAGKFLASNAQQCVKSARIRSYSDRYFPAFALNTPFLSLSLSLSPYSGSGGMRGGNADQNISKYRHFLRSSLFTYIFRGSTHQLNKNNILFQKETLFPSIKDLKLLIIARKCIAWILRLGNCLRLQYFLLVVTDPRVCIKKPLLVESAVQLIALPWSYLKSNNIKAQAKTSNVKKQFYL